MKKVRVDRERTTLLKRVLYVLGGSVPVNRLEFGGGTVLAGRWKHRISTDIDLFMTKDIWDQFNRDVIRACGEIGEVTARVLHHMVLGVFSDGSEFSIGGSKYRTNHPLANEYELNTGIRLHSTAEILTRKVYWRMLAQPQYLIRDAYDVVCAQIHDPKSVQIMLNTEVVPHFWTVR